MRYQQGFFNMFSAWSCIDIRWWWGIIDLWLKDWTWNWVTVHKVFSRNYLKINIYAPTIGPHTAKLLKKQYHVQSPSFLEDELNCVFLQGCLWAPYKPSMLFSWNQINFALCTGCSCWRYFYVLLPFISVRNEVHVVIIQI